jgi:hypothetical protein
MWVPAFCAVSCAGNFDSTRDERPFERHSTLGQEVFGVLCDRVGASVLAEDIEGRSYHALCHPDHNGKYANAVDAFQLPPVSGSAAVVRNLAIAKLERMANRRQDIIRAMDVIAPDIEIDDPYPPKGSTGKRRVRLHKALAELLQRLNPLYDSNPLEAVGGTPEPLFPATTQALARVFASLADNRDAQEALAYMGGRKGYRPAAAALGAIQPVLSYPHLRALSQQSVRMLSPGGPARKQFTQLLNVVHEEMRSSKPSLPLGVLQIDDPEGIAQPNRPRDNLEVLQHVLLATSPRFGTESSQPGLLVMRDYRGFALVTGNTPGVLGSVPAPFADANGDGLADVDAFGRFIGLQGTPVAVDAPFLVPGEPRIRPADPYGRAVLDDGAPAYQYIDTTQTLFSSLMRDMSALLDPDQVNERETMMYALAGATVLFGDRVPSMTYTYGEGKNARTIEYTGFDPDTSPIVDLVHAFGQVLADPQSDDFLAQMIDLFENHENLMARVVGMALDLKRIADEHPEAGLPRESFFWDHLASVLGKISSAGLDDSDPDAVGLLEDVLLSLTNDDTLALSDVYAKFMTYRDVLNYNRHNINGPAWNYTTNTLNPPKTPVNRALPATGDNMSMFHRSMQIVFDSTRTTSCNKAGAKVYLDAEVIKKFSMNLVYPDDGVFSVLCPSTKKDPVDWCDIFQIDDLTQFYLQSIVEDDPKLPASENKGKARLIIKDACLSSLDWATDMDDAFERSSGIEGMSTRPTHQALNRLVFFGADASNLSMPDLDPMRHDEGLLNQKLNQFIWGLQEPMGTPLCAKNSAGVNVCTTAETTLRARNPGALFLWEQFGFAEANRPVLRAFYQHDREDLFAEMIDVMYFHMPASDHGPECSKTGSWNRDSSSFNPRYCAESGVVTYEPLIVEQLGMDLLPTVHTLLETVAAQKIDSKRYRKALGRGGIQRRGTEVMAAMTRLLFDPDLAAKRKITYRSGTRSTVWNDGQTKMSQTTPFAMLAEAFNRIDDRFALAKDYEPTDRENRQAQWKKARSQLVDRFLAVEGKGSQARFVNPAIPKAIVMVLRTLREQVNAHCPDREKGVECTWAKHDMSRKVAEVLADPLFAAIIDLVDELRKDPSRIEIERLAQYLLEAVESDETMRKVLTSAVDLIMVLRDGQTLPPLFNVLSSLSTPESDPAATGSADVTLQLLNVLSRDPDDTTGPDDPLVFDRYRAFDHLVANLVKPIDPSQPSKTALEVLIDVAADIHRADSASDEPLTAEDYRLIADNVRRFLIDDTRGVEQLYEVVRGAKGD